MRDKFLTSCIILAIIFIAGCSNWELPQGNPPKGEILLPPNVEVFTFDRAVDNIITSLAIYTSEKLPNANIKIATNDNKLTNTAQEIIKKIAVISGAKLSSKSNIELRLRTNKNILEADLFDNKNDIILWQRNFKIKNY